MATGTNNDKASSGIYRQPSEKDVSRMSKKLDRHASKFERSKSSQSEKCLKLSKLYACEIALTALVIAAMVMVIFGSIASHGLNAGSGAFGYNIGLSLGSGLSDALWGTGTAILGLFILRVLYHICLNQEKNRKN